MLTRDRVAGVVLALFGLFVIWESRALPLGSIREPGPGFLPVTLAVVLLCFGAVVVATGALSPRTRAFGWAEWRHAVAILATCAFAALAIERLGYRLTMLVALLFLLKVVERKGWVLTAAFAFGIAFGTFYLFDTVLRVLLPRGPFGI